MTEPSDGTYEPIVISPLTQSPTNLNELFLKFTIDVTVAERNAAIVRFEAAEADRDKWLDIIRQHENMARLMLPEIERLLKRERQLLATEEWRPVTEPPEEFYLSVLVCRPGDPDSVGEAVCRAREFWMRGEPLEKEFTHYRRMPQPFA